MRMCVEVDIGILRGSDVPLARALAVGPRAGIPDRLVRHDVWLKGGLGG